MARTKEDYAKARCPFFLSSGREDVSCEGVVENSKLILIFGSERERNGHREIFCDGGYQACRLYQAIMKKYEEDKG